MLDADQLREAVDIQRRCYELLRWVDGAIRKGFIRFDTAHDYMSEAEAAAAWLDRHYADIPPRCRPRERRGPALARFANYFASYLVASFEALQDPPDRLVSPCGCYCACCTALVAGSYLKPKRLTESDKRKARAKVVHCLEDLAREHRLQLEVTARDALLADRELAEQAALVAYGHDLLRRISGSSADPSSLALWRMFAWTATGAPKTGFELTAEAILEAERRVLERLRP